MTRTIRVPGSIGNMGPGFDTLGLAVSVYLRVHLRRRIDDGKGRLITTAAAERPRARDGVAAAFAVWPFRTRRPASFEVEVESDIPERAGLGSSAAATIAGLRLRELCDGKRSVGEILDTTSRLECHPDNAAAALFGGLTSSSVAGDGHVQVGRWRWPAAWQIVVATPHEPLSTTASRRVVPRKIPLPDVVFNLQRLALLLHAVQTRDASRLAAAFEDRSHQPYRERLVPVLERALAWRHPDVMGVCLSGSGPSIAVFAQRNLRAVERAVAALYRSEGVACTIRTLRVHR